MNFPTTISTNNDYYVARYKYSKIYKDLPILSEIEIKTAKKRNGTGQFVDDKIALIIEQLFTRFKDLPAVYIKKGENLTSSLYLEPEKRCAYFKPCNLLEMRRGANKKGSLGLYIQDKCEVKRVMKFVPGVARYIPDEELLVSKTYSGQVGFPICFSLFKYEKPKSNTSKSVLLMEYFHKDVRHLINEKKALTFGNIYVIFHDTALALLALHKNKRIHGDIKEENLIVMFSSDNTTEVLKAAVCDFGASRDVSRPPTLCERLRKHPILVHGVSHLYYSPQSWKHFYDENLRGCITIKF